MSAVTIYVFNKHTWLAIYNENEICLVSLLSFNNYIM